MELDIKRMNQRDRSVEVKRDYRYRNIRLPLCSRTDESVAQKRQPISAGLKPDPELDMASAVSIEKSDGYLFVEV